MSNTIDLKAVRENQKIEVETKLNDLISKIGTKGALKVFEKYTNFQKYYMFGENGSIKFYPKVLSKNLLKKYKCINLTGQEFDTLVYDDGVYKKNNILRDEVNNALVEDDTNPEKHRVLTMKEIREQCLKNPDDINPDKNLINFKNGMYDIRNNKIIEHNPDYLSTIQINAEYKDECLDIDDTLFGHLLRTSLTEDSRIILQEIFGYCLTRNMDAQKFFILYGKGSNGKSQILNVLKALFPKNATSSLELKHFQDDVRMFGIFNKYINICADISSEYIEDDSLIKRATGEDWIQCNPKYRDGFDFECTAKILFSCNELPNVSDKIYGFMRRLIIIPFDNKIKEEDKIYAIANKIIEDKETMNAVVRWAIEGLKRLMNNNWKFTERGKIKEAKKNYELENNSVKKFISEYCIFNIKDSFIPVTEFKKVYKLWCEHEEIKSLGNKNIETTIGNNCNKIKNTLFKGWYYEGICWNQEVTNLIKEFKEQISINGMVDNYETNEREGIQNG